jgi:hypothetical protein
MDNLGHGPASDVEESCIQTPNFTGEVMNRPSNPEDGPENQQCNAIVPVKASKKVSGKELIVYDRDAAGWSWNIPNVSGICAASYPHGLNQGFWKRTSPAVDAGKELIVYDRNGASWSWNMANVSGICRVASCYPHGISREFWKVLNPAVNASRAVTI